MVDGSGGSVSETQHATVKTPERETPSPTSSLGPISASASPQVFGGRSLLRRADSGDRSDSRSSSTWISGASQAEGSEDDVFSSPVTQSTDGALAQPHPHYRLPDVRRQTDDHGILQRRLNVYQSFTASTERMANLGPVRSTLFSTCRSLSHAEYKIKNVATVKCDLCHQKCCTNSEVYQCRQCTAQMCRECVEDKLVKEDTQGVIWEWRGVCHLPFKQAYLLRKNRGPGPFGQGNWIGSVKLPNSDGVIQVELRMMSPLKEFSKNPKVAGPFSPGDGDTGNGPEGKKSSKPEGQVTKGVSLSTRGRTDQRNQVQRQTMKTGLREKLDRIREAAAENESGRTPVTWQDKEINVGVAGQQASSRDQHSSVTRMTSPIRGLISLPSTSSTLDLLNISNIIVTMADDDSQSAELEPPQQDQDTPSDSHETITEEKETETRPDLESSAQPIDWLKRTYDTLPPPWKPTPTTSAQKQSTHSQSQSSVAKVPPPPTKKPAMGVFSPAKPTTQPPHNLRAQSAPQHHKSHIRPIQLRPPTYPPPTTSTSTTVPTSIAPYQNSHNPHNNRHHYRHAPTPTLPSFPPTSATFPSSTSSPWTIPYTPPHAYATFFGSITTADSLHTRLVPTAIIAVERGAERIVQIPIEPPLSTARWSVVYRGPPGYVYGDGTVAAVPRGKRKRDEHTDAAASAVGMGVEVMRTGEDKSVQTETLARSKKKRE